MREWLEWSTQAVQVLGVAVIVGSIFFGSLRFPMQWPARVTDSYRAYRAVIGRSLLLSLEFMVAADVMRTVLLDLTAKGLDILGELIAIRTFLSWSVTVNFEGQWPWQPAPRRDSD